MAKNSVRDFDATAANNTDIQSVDIAENCAPSGINNAIRELMADIKDVSAGTVALESPQADSLTVTGDLTVDTNTLFVDASANAVGLGTLTPSTTLDVVRAGVQPLRVESTSGTEVAINMVNTGGNVQLEAHSGNFTIDADNVGIGTSSPSAGLHIDNPDNGAITAILDTDNSAVKMVFRNNTETGNNVQIGADGSSFVALTGGTERLRILSGGGITFNGDTAAANALDDYEEGTFSTSITPVTSGGVFLTTGSNTLSYVKIGSIVHVQGYVRVDSVSSPVGYFKISLPFTAKSGNAYRAAATLSVNGISSNNVTDMWGIVDAGTSFIAVYMGDSNSVVVDSAQQLQASSDFRIQATYQVA